MSSRVGDRAPAHCTGLGKALLAYEPEAVVRESLTAGLRAYTPKTITRMSALLTELAKVRTVGYAVDDEEHEVGVVCVAAPVFELAPGGGRHQRRRAGGTNSRRSPRLQADRTGPGGGG